MLEYVLVSGRRRCPVSNRAVAARRQRGPAPYQPRWPYPDGVCALAGGESDDPTLRLTLQLTPQRGEDHRINDIPEITRDHSLTFLRILADLCHHRSSPGTRCHLTDG